MNSLFCRAFGQVASLIFESLWHVLGAIFSEMSRLNRHLSTCPRLSPILPFVARVAIYFTNVLSRYCLLDLALSLIVITYSRHGMTSHQLNGQSLCV
jgi:hypothetical protein